MSEREIIIEELQNLTVDEIVEQLAKLNAEQLVALHALESADNNGGRVTLLRAIETHQAKQNDQQGGGNGAGEGDPSPVSVDAAPEAPAPTWQAEDYTGPLSIDQANWRRENVKPARQVREK